MTNESDKALQAHLHSEMSRWAHWYKERANERYRAWEDARREADSAATLGFAAYGASVLRHAGLALEIAKREYESFVEAVLNKPRLQDSKGAIDAWRVLAQGNIPPLAPAKRGRPKDLAATIRAEAAQGIAAWFEMPDECGLWLAWLGVLRLWRTMNPGVPEPFITHQSGWLEEAEAAYRAERRADPERTGTRKGERICDLLIARLDQESSLKRLGQ